MTHELTTQTIRIGGMTCINCQNRIENKLKSIAGVQDAQVDYNTGTAAVSWNQTALTFNEIKTAIEELDYKVLDEKTTPPFAEITGTLVIIIALFILLRGLGLGALTSAFPLAEAGMSYGMLFIIGLITSVHCIAMCGGINLSQTLGGGLGAPPPGRGAAQDPHSGAGVRGASPPLSILLPSFLYNGGRVISYTAVGALAGALGGAITVSGRFQGIVQIAAGVFMVIIGANMLGVFPALRRFVPRMPQFFAHKIHAQKSGNKHPLVIGLLNGLMPCGPLQAMQIYALSTGSPLAGGFSMFLFALGTVPLMFGMGALSSFLSGGTRGRAFTRHVLKAGAILVTVMGMMMFSYGWGLSGFNFDFIDKTAIWPDATSSGMGADGGVFTPVIENGVQIVKSTLLPGRYPAITVQQGIPVHWTINAPAESINGCNNRMIIREYNIEHRFTAGDNIIEFIPERTGKFPYSCWMGMIRSSITVVAEGETTAATEPSLEPTPAGVAIPTDHIVLAEMHGAETYGFPYQAVTVNLRDEGIEPAVVVLLRDMPALLTVNNDSLDPGNSRLVFPAYYTQFDIKKGDNALRLMPSNDFDFSTGDNVFYGYVKVVDDLNAVDIEAIKTEISEHETMVYPETYFEAAAQSAGGACCR
ncbi:MAG: sulfite exporter TauE/SafE family protein [Spirochaetaceae bacterium]|jgi:sulfite exporter TauE/SafE/copper chaperone CopZ|nr:sulfite exporter TauE/SafE family protein [Spirochaetaceae bacterium]